MRAVNTLAAHWAHIESQIPTTLPRETRLLAQTAFYSGAAAITNAAGVEDPEGAARLVEELRNFFNTETRKL